METTAVPPRLGVVFGYSGEFAETAHEAVEYERIGVDLLTVAEAYSFDAVSQLGYLAAKTTSITLASGILPIYSRTPALLAMTAAGLDFVSGGRFELGLGSSGPQVIEGFHGVPFSAPLGRIRENVEICRTVWRREPLDHQGTYYQAPLGSDRGRGLGKPLKLVNHPVRSSIPITIAALTPKAVAQAAEIADGWVPIFFHPEKSAAAWGGALAEGAALRSPELKPLDIIAKMPFYIGDDVDEALETYRQTVALYVGGMGARGANFYNDLATGYGFGPEAATVQELYLTGRKAEAVSALPEDLVTGTSLIGTESHVRDRVAALRDSGVTTVSVSTLAQTTTARIEQLEALRAMLH
ncbi:LLM class F420-dependent oxidoreductase [Subtercola sp. PAMC28395]|uniref:LLM class F420-dependent oxidoreductase n=1 Tax=Subtercola sp. PAMC28395 TaxID=2846775 RepID=UPI001C0C44A6|nr:LLM class F420-dependent oxidoreductase [Subtercola sp. PAMC28395]QWT24497.1 LLM class F420-dependent oxidoreductase [Subtercola sp. PAMC28395]